MPRCVVVYVFVLTCSCVQEWVRVVKCSTLGFCVCGLQVRHNCQTFRFGRVPQGGCSLRISDEPCEALSLCTWPGILARKPGVKVLLSWGGVLVCVVRGSCFEARADLWICPECKTLR